MIIKTWVLHNGEPKAIQEINYESSGFTYYDGYSYYLFDIFPSNVVGSRKTSSGESDPFTQDWVILDNSIINGIKNRITVMKNEGIIELTNEGLQELLTHIDNITFYRKAGWDLTGKAPEDQALRIEISGTGSCGGIGNTQVTQLNDIWNNYDYGTTTSSINFGETVFTDKSYKPLPMFINLINKAIENDVIKPSDEILNFINDNISPIVTDLSFKWDVYLNTSKDKLVINKTNDVTIRWSAAAINNATREFITQHPDYLYRSDNTVIKIKVSQSGNPSQATIQDVTTQLYGDIEFSIKMDELAKRANVTDFMESIGSLLPFTKAGDIYLYMYAEFEDGKKSGVVIQQVPLNSMTQDTTMLYHKNASDGSTVTIHYGLPETLPEELLDVAFDPLDFDDKYTDDTYKDNDSSSDFTSKTDSHNSAIGLLTDTYLVTESQLKEIGGKIWSGEFTSLIDTLNSSPIENIISCKSFPWELSDQGAQSAEIVLGNVEMGVNGLKLNPNYLPKRTLKRHFTIEKKFPQKLNFLNFAPFTNCFIFLPYVGIKEIDLNKVYGKDCELVMIYDVICGGCQYVLKAAGIELQKWSGEVAIDIPITASNRVEQGAAYITGGLSTVAQVLSGNIVGALTTGLQTAMTPFHSTTTGTPSSSLESFDGQEVFLIIDRPMYDEPSNYGHLFGYPCNLQLNLNHLHGFVKCKNVHLDGIPCTDEIRARLQQRLERGVYL